jgi:hypothetical protein
MPHFAILRTEKLKTLGAVAGSLSHTYRTRETPNAEPRRAAENAHTGQGAQEVMQALKTRLPAKHRKDAVLALEYFVGASPEWFEGKTRDQENAYFRQAVDWLKQRHGAENVVGWSIHRDESSPHLVAYVVPLDDSGKLNAKKWTGGAAALSRMQTDFAKKVGAKHGLERGIEGSKATHQAVKDWYAQINQPSQHVTITKDDIKPHFDQNYGEYESPEQIAERLTASIKSVYAPAVEKAKVFESERRRASEMAKTAKTLADEKKEVLGRLRTVVKVFAPLIELGDLAKAEFDQIMNSASERVRCLKAERHLKQKPENQKLPSLDEIRKQPEPEPDNGLDFD